MKFLKNNWIYIVIILGVLFAWWLVGDVALGGLLLLVGAGGQKKKRKAADAKAESDAAVKEAIAKVEESQKFQGEAEEVLDDLTKIANQPVDTDEPIEQVVEDAKKDW